jgi:hypothetical protein
MPSLNHLKVNVSVRLIKHHAMKKCAGVAIQIQVFYPRP